ncbi:hypothetical protein ADUPG1_003044, partial [Aduncisulcus paluster]
GVNVTIAVSDTTPKDLFSSKNPSSSTAVAAEMQAVVSNEQALSADDHDSISADDHDSMSTDDHESMSAGHECHVDLDVGVHTHSVAKSDERVVSQDPIQEPVPAKHSTPIEHQVATKSDSVAAESSEHVYDVDDSVSVNVSNVPEAKTVKHVKSKSDLGATDEDESGHTVESGHMVESGHTVESGDSSVESGDSSDGEGVIAPIKHIDETGESVDHAPHGVNVTIAVSDTTPKDLFSSKNPSSSTAVAAEMQAVVSNEQALSAD